MQIGAEAFSWYFEKKNEQINFKIDSLKKPGIWVNLCINIKFCKLQSKISFSCKLKKLFGQHKTMEFICEQPPTLLAFRMQSNDFYTVEKCPFWSILHASAEHLIARVLICFERSRLQRSNRKLERWTKIPKSYSELVKCRLISLLQNIWKTNCLNEIQTLWYSLASRQSFVAK